jgi:hypothetical protein
MPPAPAEPSPLGPDDTQPPPRVETGGSVDAGGRIEVGVNVTFEVTTSRRLVDGGDECPHRARELTIWPPERGRKVRSARTLAHAQCKVWTSPTVPLP